MKCSTKLILLTVVAPAAAFAPALQGAASISALHATNNQSTRSGFLKQAVVGMTSLAFLPNSANAAKYGSFGAGSPEVLSPSEAVVDKELLSSDSVQKSLASVKKYLGTVNGLKDALAKDSQADISGFVLREFDFTKLRTDLNTLGTVYDEDTQRGTDRLIRIILQDITELESSSKLKPGIPRSERRLTAMNGKLDKLSRAFEDYLAFAK